MLNNLGSRLNAEGHGSGALVLWLCAEGQAGKTQGFSIVDVQAVTCDWLLENMPPEYGKSNLQDLF